LFFYHEAHEGKKLHAFRGGKNISSVQCFYRVPTELIKYSCSAGLYVLLCFFPSQALAAEIATDHDAGRYQVQLTMDTTLSAQEVYAKLTDFNHLNRINPSILESKLLGVEPDGAKRVYSMIRGCVFLFCENMRRVELVYEQEQGLIVSKILPELSDFKSGWSRWRISSSGSGAHIVYKAELEPSFRVPALGAWLMKRSIKKELKITEAILRGEKNGEF